MSHQSFIGVDLGAESGRVMAGAWDGHQLKMEELHRFPNGPISLHVGLCWDVLRLWEGVEAGLCLAKSRGEIRSIGVDTWALDFVLLSKSGELLGWPRNYRDPRTRGYVEKACSVVPREEIFAASGLQFMEINTLYQLLALRDQSPEILDAAHTFLMIPDYLHWCLSGVRAAEFTNATTTQFFHPTRHTWSVDLLDRLGLPSRILPPIVEPGTVLGGLRPEVTERTGLRGVELIAVGTHDTASAVAGVPARRTASADWAYLSSGTWSLLGVELPAPDLSQAVYRRNLTNEGGVDGTYRLLKNIMGLWLVQRCRASFAARGVAGDYADLVQRAHSAPAFRSFVDPDDQRFLNPADMPTEMASYCRETGQPIPETEGEFFRCALESLALKYAEVLEWLEESTGCRIGTIHVVGGGAKNSLLNQFTADATGCRVIAGPAEATVMGNLLVQLRASGEISSAADAHEVARRSSALTEFEPRDTNAWRDARSRFDGMRSARN